MMAELQSESEARPRFIPPREEAQDFRLHDQDGDLMSCPTRAATSSC